MLRGRDPTHGLLEAMCGLTGAMNKEKEEEEKERGREMMTTAAQRRRRFESRVGLPFDLKALPTYMGQVGSSSGSSSSHSNSSSSQSSSSN